jgi:PTH1 family peptidyl-tRNA hydrolase
MNKKIKIIVGLGNPGRQFHYTRHNIGFLVLDALADKHGAIWQTKGDKEVADVTINGEKITLVKPQTYMNNSGKVMPSLLKHGVTIENVLVVHDELEKPFGVVDIKTGGSHRGHNGLRSIMQQSGAAFTRVRCGISRPEHKEDVADYVLSNFSEGEVAVEKEIEQAVLLIENQIKF